MHSVVTVWNAVVLQSIVAVSVWHVRKILHTFLTSAAVKLRYSLFCDVTQRTLAVIHRHFGIT